MSSRVSSQKRKHSEYYDPDYIRTHSIPIKTLRIENDNITRSDKLTNVHARLKSISEIISGEFEKEITLKQEQLAEIECRLEHARSLLERLRYVTVAEYYRKQELSLAASDVTAVRGITTLFDNEVNGPQKAHHPSLKNIVGKRPTNIPEELGRLFPERIAAQNALNTIRVRSPSLRHQERRLQQLITEQGLVIDHSKEPNGQMPKAVATFNQIKTLFENSRDVQETIHISNLVTPANTISIKPSSKSLNATRLNNKTKQLIVIGNTSTYIGAETVVGAEHKTSGCTHKWLVYVQTKDSSPPLESFIRKVRFHLHPSFRPNDIVDVRTPPFQIVRRGWGEFPMRIQLFFHEHMHQKPVQLIHNLALDRTLSGMHTLGAETLLEIWLRTDVAIKLEEHEAQLTHYIKDIEESISDEETRSASQQILSNSTNVIATTPENTSTSNRKMSFTQTKEEVDANLFGLNKNVTISADITKIQPSVVVKEHLANSSTSRPIKIKSECSHLLENDPGLDIVTKDLSPAENLSSQIDHMPSALGSDMINIQKVPRESASVITTTTESAISRQATTSPYKNDSTQSHLSNPLYTKAASTISTAPSPENKEIRKAVITNKSMQLTTPMIMRLPTSNIAGSHSTTNNSKNKNNIIALSRVGKLMPLKIANVAKMIAPNASYSPINVPLKNSPGKAVLQKKLVQLIDAEGKIKFMEVLVAITQKPPILTSNANKLLGNTKSEAVVSVRNACYTSPASTEAAPFNKSSSAITDNDASKNVADCTTAEVLATSNSNNKIKLESSMSNDKTVISPKQMVFQKEGKLFIIDPLQIKLKQERRKQISLLKPKTNLPGQRQQQVQDQKMQSKAFRSMISDHDYTPSLDVKDCDASTTETMLLGSTTSQSYAQAPGFHLGIRRPRVNASSAFELLQQRRIQLEKDFLDQNIQSMRSAVDYILRRLPLIAAKNTLAAAFSFVNHSLEEFDALPVMKQRACEWLRAKYVTRFVRNHKHLQKLNSCDKERFWSTREVLVYARHHAYTPRMKSFDVEFCLLQPQPRNLPSEAKLPQCLRSIPLNKSKLDNETQRGQELSQFVKNEVKYEQEYFQYESISYNCHIASWLDGTWQKLIINGANTEFSDEPIDIVSVPVSENCGKILNANPQSKQPDSSREKQKLYLPVPEHLVVSAQLVSDICRDLNLQLQPEHVENGVIFPLAQSIVAQCLKMFVEKLTRRAVASKQSLTTADNFNITTQDIGKVLVRHAEFDFLTNKNFGTYKYDRG